MPFLAVRTVPIASSTVRDVIKDEEAFAEVQRMGATGTPVTVRDSEEVVFGFDRKKLEELLGF